MGRGSSGLSGGGGGGKSLYNGLYIEGTASNQKNADEVMRGVRDTLNDFGFADELTGVVFNNKGAIIGGDAKAAINGFGQLTINNKDIASDPIDSNGYSVNDSFYGLGAHEAGHAIINGLLKNNVSINPDITGKTDSRARLERATARHKGKLEHEILKEAKKRYGSNPKISGYGSTKEAEKVAEAFSDVYANKGKANPYSKVIVGVAKDIKNGSFTPKIRVSNREMGI